MKRRRRPANVPAIEVPAQVISGEGFVTAVIYLDDNSSIGLKFESLIQLMTFMSELIEHAARVWPDDALMAYYNSQENDDDTQ